MTAITPLPDAPLISDDTPTFNAKAFAFANALADFVSEINAEIPSIDAAIPAAATALGAANYKGEWSTLSGALSLPASVSNSGSLWLLITNTSNVASDVPGVSAKWLSLTDYVRLTGNQTITGVKTFSSDPVMGVSGLSGSIAAARLLSALNASGSAPIYAPRAWVRFDGTTATIKGSGNVASVTRNGAGDYTIAFTIAMPDANYAVLGTANSSAGVIPSIGTYYTGSPSASQVRVTVGDNVSPYDSNDISITVVR